MRQGRLMGGTQASKPVVDRSGLQNLDPGDVPRGLSARTSYSWTTLYSVI